MSRVSSESAIENLELLAQELTLTSPEDCLTLISSEGVACRKTVLHVNESIAYTTADLNVNERVTSRRADWYSSENCLLNDRLRSYCLHQG